jgi:hypothetical protein
VARAGGTQLHLFERDLTPTSHHHPGITVDDQRGADRLPDDLRALLKLLWGFNEQSDEQMSARLYVR